MNLPISKNQNNNPSHTKKTLDIQHNNKLFEFSERNNKLQEAKNKFNEIHELIINLEKKKKLDKLNDIEQDNLIKYIDERYTIKNLINSLENVEDEIDYLVNTAPILFKYYEIIEKGANEDTITPQDVSGNSILKFFIKKDDDNNEKINKESTKQEYVDKASLTNKYLSYTDPNYIKNVSEEHLNQCSSCGSTNRNILINDGIIFCNECDSVEYIIVDHDRPSYKDPPREITYFSYKRINHYNEWLSQIQGKETTEIPEEIIDMILLELRKERITNMANVENAKIKQILKKLRLNKYYEHSHHILHKITGLPIPHLEPEIEEKLRSMFKLIQPLFLKHMPSGRKNFLSYSYCIHKFVQLLGRDDLLPYFTLLKSRDKLMQQDEIFKKICQELGWEFIRSI